MNTVLAWGVLLSLVYFIINILIYADKDHRDKENLQKELGGFFYLYLFVPLVSTIYAMVIFPIIRTEKWKIRQHNKEINRLKDISDEICITQRTISHRNIYNSATMEFEPLKVMKVTYRFVNEDLHKLVGTKESVITVWGLWIAGVQPK